jgi:hypothetical protein
MKIIYYTTKQKIDGYIVKALKKLGHSVVEADNLDFEPNCDLFLFRNTAVPTHSIPAFFEGLDKIAVKLQSIKCKKVMWFTDKVIGMGEDLLENVIPLADKVFMNDDTWRRRHDYKNVYPLHLATGGFNQGKRKKEFECEVAFNGDISPAVFAEINATKKMFGPDFKLFNAEGKDFADLCASAGILVYFRDFQDDFYWKDDIYEALANRAFVIFPRLHDMDLKDGEHYVGYGLITEMVDAIKWFMQHTQTKDEIMAKGQKYVLENCTYENRLKELLSKL